MAFRRNYRRGARPTGFTRRLNFKANKRRTWVPGLVQNCGYQAVAYNPGTDPDTGDPYCAQVFKLTLLDQTHIDTLFSDSVKVKRVFGDIRWLWDLALPDPCSAQGLADNLSRISSFEGLHEMGLHRFDVSSAEPNGVNYNYIDKDFDFTESRAIHTWRHHWQPHTWQSAKEIIPGALLGCCPHVTKQQGLDSELAEGSGIIFGDPAITTDCQLCYYSGEVTCNIHSSDVNATYPRPWVTKMNLKFRKGIQLRENQQLALNVNFAQLGYAAPIPPADRFLLGMHFYARIKLLLEY